MPFFTVYLKKNRQKQKKKVTFCGLLSYFYLINKIWWKKEGKVIIILVLPYLATSHARVIWPQFVVFYFSILKFAAADWPTPPSRDPPFPQSAPNFQSLKSDLPYFTHKKRPFYVPHVFTLGNDTEKRAENCPGAMRRKPRRVFLEQKKDKNIW